MRTIIQQLRRLEDRIAGPGQVDSAWQRTQRAAERLWERRRRRLEASGQPCEDRPPQPLPIGPVKCVSAAETLQRRREQIAAAARKTDRPT
jgi:hypothetical protein